MRPHLALAAAAAAPLACSLACLGATDWTGGTGSWSLDEAGTCVNTLVYSGSDDHLQITGTRVTSSAGYADFALLEAWPAVAAKRANFNPDGTFNTNTWNGARDPRGVTFRMTIESDTSGSTTAAGCQAAFGTIRWDFTDTDASSKAKATSAPAGATERCLPTEVDHDTERRLVALPGAPGRLPLATEDRTDAGAVATEVEILDFAGAAALTLDTPQGALVLTPQQPAAALQMDAADLSFRATDLAPEQTPRARVRTTCALADAVEVTLPTGYAIDRSWLGLVDPAIGQELVARVVDGDPPYLLTTARGATVGSTLSLARLAPGTFALADARLDADLTLTETGGGLLVEGTVQGAPVSATFHVER
ncbi:MAG: hypothetical protein R3F59_30345 [Myxococcota bacterium]